MTRFVSPRILSGKNILKRLGKELRGIGDTAVMITGQTTSRLSGSLVDALNASGIKVHIWDGAVPEPSVETAVAAGKFLEAINPQLVIGFGGGSAMDLAKAAWVFYERPDLAETDNLARAINPKAELNLRKKAKFMAVPTTSGSGSEVTWALVLTDKKRQRKLGVANDEIVPDFALLIPELTVGMPETLTACTGLDVLGHALDGLTARQQTDFSDGPCIHAVKMVFDWLPRACKDGSDLVARQKMQNAAAIAGLGFGNSNTSLSHALAHAIGVAFDMGHGRAVGLSLPYSLAYIVSKPAIAGTPDPVSKLALAARMVGVDAASEPEAIEKFIIKIKSLARQIKEPLTLKDAGVSQQDFTDKLDSIVNLASRDVNIHSCPCECKETDLNKIFIEMYE